MPIYVERPSESSRTFTARGNVLLVEQNARKALAAADRGYVLETGEIVLCDSSQALASDPQVKKAYLGGA
jgi:branched-chain amino acid transport system ATP-binding protein